MDLLIVFREMSFPPGGAISCIVVDSVLIALHSSCSYSEWLPLQIGPTAPNELLSRRKRVLQCAGLTGRGWHKVGDAVCIDTVVFEA